MWNALPAPSAGRRAAHSGPVRADARFRDPHQDRYRHAVLGAGDQGSCRASRSRCTIGGSSNTPPHHRDSDPNDLRADSDPVLPQLEVPKYPPLHADASPRWSVIAANARAGDADLVYPAGPESPLSGGFRAFRLGLSGHLLCQRARPLLARQFDRPGPPAERRLSQHRRLLSRRHRPDGIDPGRKRASASWTGCGTSSISSPTRRRAPGPSITSTRAARWTAKAMNPDRRGRPITRSPTPRSSWR